MAYSRPINPGLGLKQIPTINPGVQELTLDTDIATTSSLGIVQVGSGLSVTALGVLSATGSASGLYSVKLTAVNYTALADDFYIGAIKKDICITLPIGVVGKLYIVKNQVSGDVTVAATAAQKIDAASTKQLGTNQSITVIFDGTRWNIVE
jgi:hypothetical protein